MTRSWTPAECILLRHLYPSHDTQHVADLLGRSFEATESKAKEIRVRKTKVFLVASRKAAVRTRAETMRVQEAEVRPPAAQPVATLRPGVVYGKPLPASTRHINGNALRRMVAACP